MKDKIIYVLVFFCLLSVSSYSQCAMCKAQLETNDGEVGNGINSGIIFLMIIPYVLLTSIVLVFFRGRIISSVKKFINN